MAEIKIEKKKTIWPWILLVLIALGLLYFFFAVDDVDTIDVEETEEVITVVEDKKLDNVAIGAFSTALTKYSTYIDETAKMGIDHEYSNGALNYLIDAVEAKATVLDVNITADLEAARENATKITKDPYDLNHADLIRNSGIIITKALRTMQEAKYPNLTTETSEVNTAVLAITKKEHTLNQKGDVKKFFKAAELLLIKMQ